MFAKYLIEIGLSEKEAEVYLSLLEGDSYSILVLSKKTKINRTTIYSVIKSLSEKGLVSETTINTKTNYHAESPDRLESFVNRPKYGVISNQILVKKLGFRLCSWKDDLDRYIKTL